MDIINELNFDFYIKFLKGIQELIGENCEIIVNDFRKGFDNAIVHSINSELVSGRKVGDKPRGAMILHNGKNIDSLKDNYNFFYKGDNGKLFKSSTTLISDCNRKVIGSVCINIDISQMAEMQKYLNNILNIKEEKLESEDKDEIVVNNIDDVLHYYIEEAEKRIGKSMKLMNRDEKIMALRYLDEKGVMKISKANIVLCEALNISKFTLYNYLDESRK